MSDFTLDSRLAADTYLVGELTLSRVLLMRDARFPWVILVPRRADKREILDLDAMLSKEPQPENLSEDGEEAEPEIKMPLIFIQLRLEGVQPEDSERLLIRPVEEEMQALRGIKEVRATGFQGGASIVMRRSEAARRFGMEAADIVLVTAEPGRSSALRDGLALSETIADRDQLDLFKLPALRGSINPRPPMVVSTAQRRSA